MNTILLIFIGIIVLVSYKGFNDEQFFRKYQFHIGSIRAGEHIRMISSGFLHADISHLFFNLLALYLFAPVIIEKFGNTSFGLIFLVSLISGSLLTLIMHKNDYNYTAIGASGAVTGILYSAILINPAMSINFIPAPLFGIGYLLYSIYGMKSKNDNIGHTAHFGGALGGYLLTLTKDPSIFATNLPIVAGLAVPIIILFIMIKMKKI